MAGNGRWGNGRQWAAMGGNGWATGVAMGGVAMGDNGRQRMGDGRGEAMLSLSLSFPVVSR